MLALPRLTGLWLHGDFVRLWIGSTISQFGSMLGGLSFVGVVMLEATPLQMGFLGAVGVAPSLVFGLASGVWVDRVRRRPILVITNVVRAVSLASIPAAFAFDQLRIEQLYVVAFFNGVCTTFFDVSFGSYVPTLVGRGNLVEANGKLTASGSVVETIGFSVGGWIVELVSALAAVIVNALSSLISCLLFMAIRTPEALIETADGTSSQMREAMEGILFVLVNRVLRAVTGAVVAEGLLHGIVGSVVLIYGVRELGFSTGVLATIFAVGGVSSFVGATYSSKITTRLGVGPAMVIGFLLYSLGALLLAVAQGPLLVAGLVLVVWQLLDGAYIVYEINEVSLRQALTPDALLGRVTATFRFMGIAAFVLGLLSGGVLAEAMGLRQTLVLAAACGTAGAVWLLLSPVWRLKEIPKAPSPPG